MKLLKTIHRTIDKVLVFIELNLPAIFMICVFLGFVTSVSCRYLLNLPLAKVEEAYVICFCWMALFSAPLATRNEDHLSFAILYDALTPKAKAVLDVAGKSILLVILIILIKPSWETVVFYDMTKTSLLKLSYMYLYMPFMFMLLATIYHQISLIVRDGVRMVQVFRGDTGIDAQQQKGE